METIWVELVLIAVAILANGFFAGSEIALISARISRLAQLRQEAVTGDRAAGRDHPHEGSPPGRRAGHGAVPP